MRHSTAKRAHAGRPLKSTSRAHPRLFDTASLFIRAGFPDTDKEGTAPLFVRSAESTPWIFSCHDFLRSNLYHRGKRECVSSRLPFGLRNSAFGSNRAWLCAFRSLVSSGIIVTAMLRNMFLFLKKILTFIFPFPIHPIFRIALLPKSCFAVLKATAFLSESLLSCK